MKKLNQIAIVALIAALFTSCQPVNSPAPAPEPEPVYYTVSFNSNGGTAVAPQTVLSGTKATLPATEPTLADHVFAGWYANDTFTVAFDFNAAITADATAYAKWNVVTYTVTFNTQGSAVADQTVETGATCTEPSAATRLGYTFDGWDFNFATAITADTVVNAKWIAKTYTVTFILNGTALSQAWFTISFATASGTTGSEVATPAITAYNVATFKGWHVDGSKRGSYDGTYTINPADDLDSDGIINLYMVYDYNNRGWLAETAKGDMPVEYSTLSDN